MNISSVGEVSPGSNGGRACDNIIVNGMLMAMDRMIIPMSSTVETPDY